MAIDFAKARYRRTINDHLTSTDGHSVRLTKLSLVKFEIGWALSHLAGQPTTKAIIEKLRREKTRLAEMQDIAGCRIVTTTLLEQDRIVAQLQLLLNGNVIDRRYQPSHGYRAVHVIVNQFNKLVEIQVRTSLQHTWAERSEKMADEFGHEIKYGGGNQQISSSLERFSDAIFGFEEARDARNYDAIIVYMDKSVEEFGQLLEILKRERGKR